MVKSTLYTTAKVLPGNRIEIQSPDLTVGQTVEELFWLKKLVLILLPPKISLHP
ncbi:MAG: hypothetical protein ACKPJ8_15140 [Dolichospermum sp.]